MNNELIIKSDKILEKVETAAQQLDHKQAIEIIQRELKKAAIDSTLDILISEIKATQIKSEDAVLKARSDLTYFKAQYKELAAIFKSLTDKPFQFKKALDAELKKITEKVETLTMITESKVLNFLMTKKAAADEQLRNQEEAQKQNPEQGQSQIKKPITVPNVKGLREKKVRSVVILDIKKIPEKYILINEQMILRDVEAGITVPGVEIKVAIIKSLVG